MVTKVWCDGAARERLTKLTGFFLSGTVEQISRRTGPLVEWMYEHWLYTLQENIFLLFHTVSNWK